MIRTKIKNGAAFLELDRPKQRNALSYELLEKLHAALCDAGKQNATAVIISGRGGVMSAGADLKDLTGTSKDIAIDEAIATVVLKIQALNCPVIAWVDGACVGGAVDIVLACDIRVASTRAWFQIPATRLGLLYNPSAVARMYARLPRTTLSALLQFGERFDAQQAKVAGLVTHADDRNGYAAGTIPNSKLHSLVPSAVAATGQLLQALDNGVFDTDQWERLRRELLDSPERAAAIESARMKKRPLND